MDQDFSTQTPQSNNNLQFTGDPTPPPMAPMAPMTPPTKEKKSKTGLIVAIIAILLIGGGAAAFFLLQKPTNNNQSQGSNSEPAKVVELYKFKDRMTKDSYSVDDFKDKFSLGKGDVVFKLPTGVELVSASSTNVSLKTINTNKNISVNVYFSQNSTFTNERAQELCKMQGDRTSDNIKPGKFSWCKVLSELGENKFDYFEKSMLKSGDINNPNDGIIMNTYHIYFHLGDYHLDFSYYDSDGETEAQSVAIINSIKDAFSLEEDIPYIYDIAAASLPTPMNKQLTHDIMQTIYFNTSSYRLFLTISELEGYGITIYYQPRAWEGYELSKHDKAEDIDIYTKDSWNFFRLNKEKMDVVTVKKTREKKSSSYNDESITTVEDFKKVMDMLPDKK